MKTETLALPGATPGVSIGLTVLRFGQSGARPKIYVQAGLHADESPGHLAAQSLRRRLEALEAEGRIAGEVVLVPVANPIGLSQRVNGVFHGRFDMADGGNFNRHFPNLTEAAAAAIAGRLGRDEAANAELVRSALKAALADVPARTPTEGLKKHLLAEAVDADVVLDIHCDSEAVMHLYTLTPQAEAFAPLSALLGARAMLLATESGDDPFDEAVSRPWFELRRRFPDAPIPLGGLSTTLELRGQADVTEAYADADAAAIVDFLVLRGAISGPAPAIPDAACRPTPLAGSQALEAPCPGIIVFHREAGDVVSTGDVVATLVDPVSGARTPVPARTDGVLYARCGTRFAHAGKRLGKIAGDTPIRTGKLLSP